MTGQINPTDLTRDKGGNRPRHYGVAPCHACQSAHRHIALAFLPKDFDKLNENL